jgi:hypothetical protein
MSCMAGATDSPLEQAGPHVVEAEQCVAEQRALVAELTRADQDTAQPSALLETYLHSLAAMRKHLEHEEKRAKAK